MRKRKCVFGGIIALFIASCLSACGTGELVEQHINDPLAASGDLAYYAGMNADDRKALCEEHHIEVSGEVTKSGSFLLYVGSKSTDGIEIDCNFDEKVENVEKGDYVKIDGVCDGSYSDTMFLYGCRLSECTKKDEISDEVTREIPIVDTQVVEEETIKSPIASYECEGKKYDEVSNIFENAGFIVKLNPVEQNEGDTLFSDGDVIIVGAGEQAVFEKDEELPANVEIMVSYCSLVKSKSDDNSDVKSSDALTTEPQPTYNITDMSSTMYATSDVNVRSIPDTSGNKLGSLNVNESVTVTGKVDNGWYRISYNGDGFVRGDFLTAEPVVVSNPAAAAETAVTAPSNSGGNNGGESGPSVIVPGQADTEGDLVWVPTKGGKKYHSNPGCSGMEDPIQVTREHAEANGYTPCKRCH